MNTLAWISAACVLLAAGIALWGYAQQKQKVSVITERVQKAMSTAPVESGHSLIENDHRKDSSAWLKLAPLWLHSAYTPKQGLLIAVIALLLTVLIAALTNIAIALLVPLMIALCAAFCAWLKWQKLRARLIQQLPSFIDGMVRMVVLGHATSSAFVMASASAKEPLAKLVGQAASFTKAGMPIDQALQAVNRDFKLQELSLLASVIQVGGKYGGRVDGLLERVAHLIRDREQAERELRALSAEVRVSAWILSLLPVLVGGVIVILNASYFMNMWGDPSGRWIGFAGIGLQVIGTIILYRLSKLDD